MLDASRLYANRGELTTLLEARLGRRLALAGAHIVLAASGTAGLTASILAVAGVARADRPYCLCPGYTFVAGALAAERCGYLPYFLDIDPDGWTASPKQVIAHKRIRQAGVILAVAPYGQAVQNQAWDEVRRQTGVPVVIDAAASFEALADRAPEPLGETPIVLSFHATKAFGCGEGGAVISADRALLHRVYAALNFGFDGVRETSGPGFNGKMSEYHAAVGLAELDGWDEKRAALVRVASFYRRVAAEHRIRLHAAPAIASNYVLFEADSAEQAAVVRTALDLEDVGNRLWYGEGLHRQPHFRTAARDMLPGVEDLAPRLLGLPVAHDLGPDEIERIIRIVALSSAPC